MPITSHLQASPIIESKNTSSTNHEQPSRKNRQCEHSAGVRGPWCHYRIARTRSYNPAPESTHALKAKLSSKTSHLNIFSRSPLIRFPLCATNRDSHPQQYPSHLPLLRQYRSLLNLACRNRLGPDRRVHGRQGAKNVARRWRNRQDGVRAVAGRRVLGERVGDRCWEMGPGWGCGGAKDGTLLI